jgi:hypothetical protein
MTGKSKSGPYPGHALPVKGAPLAQLRILLRQKRPKLNRQPNDSAQQIP